MLMNGGLPIVVTILQAAQATQAHKEFLGYGYLLRDSRPPVPVRYYIVLSARPVLMREPMGQYDLAKPQWEWEEAHGFITLCDEADAGAADLQGKCTLVLDDSTRCTPVLFPDYSRPRMKYRVHCTAQELMRGAAGAHPYNLPARLAYDTARPAPAA